MADIGALDLSQAGFGQQQQTKDPMSIAQGVLGMNNQLTKSAGGSTPTAPKTIADIQHDYNGGVSPNDHVTQSSGSFPTPSALGAEQFYESQGMSPVQASAKVGVMMGESGPNLNPNAFNPSDPHGGAHGSMQWVGDRWTRYQNWAQTNRLPPDSLTTQLKYSMVEPGEEQYMRSLRGATDLNSAVKAAISTERPKGWTSQHPEQGAGFGQRTGNAQRLLQEVLRRKGGNPNATAASEVPNQLTQGAGNASGSFALPQS
jgi:Phage tail lysozyme